MGWFLGQSLGEGLAHGAPMYKGVIDSIESTDNGYQAEMPGHPGVLSYLLQYSSNLRFCMERVHGRASLHSGASNDFSPTPDMIFTSG